ncbi:MAG: carboxymuconolactone decarboxylase family protein [Deltaproteobacteria bacterium]|nr:carboxymuconolactone decarboxylase family protein [Deltaproteobacteria bacterium]
MKARLNPYKIAMKTMEPMSALSDYVDKCGLDYGLIELVKLRASQINGCAFCIDLHTTRLREHGDTDKRMHLVSAWRESTLFSDRERAALEWTEVLTRLADRHLPREALDRVRDQFDDDEVVKLTMTIVVINGWNRIAVPFGYEHA